MGLFFNAAAIGAVISFLAWAIPPFSLSVSLLLLVVWARAHSRREAGALAFGYFLFFAADIPFSVANFFPEAPKLVGAAIWLADAALVSLPWVIAWSPRLGIGHRVFLVSFLALLPPFGWVAWGTPYVAAGALFPGFGLAGLVLTGLAAYVIAAAWQSGEWRSRIAPVAAIAVVSLLANVIHSPAAPPPGWVSISTELGKLDRSLASARVERFRALKRAADDAIQTGAKVIVFPEEVAPDWSDRWASAWEATSRKAERHGASILLGADERREDNDLVHDSLMLLGHGAPITSWHSARVPMPVGAWRPWSEVTVAPDPFFFPSRRLQGKEVAVSVCYEDFLLWPHFHALLSRPDVMVSVANNWMVRGRPAEERQQASIAMTARLTGAPLIRAVNR